MKVLFKLFLLFCLSVFSNNCFSQKIIEQYDDIKNDGLRIGKGDNDFLPLIQSGYTLMLPKNNIEGVLVFLEDSGFDKKNNNAKPLYQQAQKIGFAVLSVSTELPFDFYFSKTSISTAHKLIHEAFIKYNLPNRNIFFLGASLVGHRALKYIEFMSRNSDEFQLNITGIVICNFTLDWTRKWYQHERDIKINRINLWEPTFMNYMLEKHLKGTPKTVPEHYHNFSTYSYFDKTNRNINTYKNFAVRAYIEPAIQYRLKKQFRTMYENSATDIVGFLAELALLGNENTELIVIQPKNDSSQKNAQATWNAIDKNELVKWMQQQTEK